MITKSLAAGLLAAGCITAAGAGAYLAVQHGASTAQPPAAETLKAEQVADPALVGPAAVAETEAIVAAPMEAPPVEKARPTARLEPARRAALVPGRDTNTAHTPAASNTRAAASSRPSEAVRPAEPPAPERAEEAYPELTTPVLPPPAAPESMPLPDPIPVPAPPEPRFEELVIPTSSVIGLQVETAVSSERAQVEDRVDARVTRDVLAAGRVAIPAGSRVVGAVTMVERGGKVKERAKLGVRFHTVVLADGSRVPLTTEAILREGEAPSGESARKIGGAAIGGAILGAIMGGKKGAIIGGATGAGAGTAAVMTGDRNAATLAAGSVVTVRLTAPATIEVERQ